MRPIEKAILTSDVGINPTNDGRVMRLVFPAPTEAVSYTHLDAENCGKGRCTLPLLHEITIAAY